MTKAADPVPSAPLRQRAARIVDEWYTWSDVNAKHQERKVLADAIEAFALAVREEATRAERERLDVEAMRANLHATFSGGHHDNPAALRAFHHGMDTVCNVLEADQKGASTNGILPAAADPGEGPGHEE